MTEPLFTYELFNEVQGYLKLATDPEGWDGRQNVLKRSPKYHGIAREHSSTLGFIAEGKTFVDAVRQREGIGGIITITISERNEEGLYDLAFTGELGLKNARKTDYMTRCPLVQTGFTQKFSARDDQKVNLSQLLSFNGTILTPYNEERQTLALHSKGIKKVFEAKGSDTRSSLLTEERPLYAMFAYDDVSQEELVVQNGFGTSTVSPVDSKNFIHLVSDETGLYSVSIKFHIRLTYPTDPAHWTNTTAQFKLVIGDNTYNIPHTTTQVANNQGPEFILETVIFSQTVTLKKGDAIYAFLEFTPPSVVLVGNFEFGATDQTILLIEAVTYDQPSTAEGTMIYEALNRVVEHLTDQEGALISEAFGRTDSEPMAYTGDGEHSHYALLNGLQIRGKDSDLVLTFNDLYASINSLFNVGVGIERYGYMERVRIEPLSYFYRFTNIQKNGQDWVITGLNDWSEEPALDYYYNELEIGYNKWETEGVNGLDETNTKHSYSLPVKKHKNRYLAVSQLVSSAYAIEQTRRSRHEPTTDYKYDNDNFIIHLRRGGTGFVPVRDDGFTNVSGTLDPTSIYNLELSPKRCLNRHQAQLKPSVLYEATEGLRFVTGEGNTGMSSQKSNEASPVVENASIAPGELAEPLWLNELYQFEAKLTAAEFNLIKDQLYSRLLFEHHGQLYKGYILELSRKTDNTTTFKLLRANG